MNLKEEIEALKAIKYFHEPPDVSTDEFSYIVAGTGALKLNNIYKLMFPIVEKTLTELVDRVAQSHNFLYLGKRSWPVFLCKKENLSTSRSNIIVPCEEAIKIGFLHNHPVPIHDYQSRSFYLELFLIARVHNIFKNKIREEFPNAL